MERFSLSYFNLKASAWSFDVALEGRSTETDDSYGFNTSRRIGQKVYKLESGSKLNVSLRKSST